MEILITALSIFCIYTVGWTMGFLTCLALRMKPTTQKGPVVEDLYPPRK